MKQRFAFTIIPLVAQFIFVAVMALTSPALAFEAVADTQSKEASVETPPATFYGWVIPMTTFEPTIGMTVTAMIDNATCGTTTITELDGQLAYTIQVVAESVFDAPNGCGTAERRVDFVIDGHMMDGSPLWDNRQAQFHPLTMSATTLSQPITPHWQLIALPLVFGATPPADALASITDSYDLVYAYEADTQTWPRYAPDGPPFGNSLESVSPITGLWLHGTVSDTLVITGTNPITATIPLSTGWNLIGIPLSESRPVADVLAPIAGHYDLVYEYEADVWRRYAPDGPPFGNSLTTITPTNGYWIHVTEITTLPVNNR